jgi:hypothetical protein
MIADIRSKFNREFTQETYDRFYNEIVTKYDHAPSFRICETPGFIPNIMKDRLIEACDEIMAVIDQPNFKELTEGAFSDKDIIVPNEDDAPKFLQFDFGVCLDENGDPIPKLIELQGFPSLYFYQYYLGAMYRKHFDIPEGFSQHVDGITPDSYLDLLRDEIVGDTNPKQIILLEIEPEKQATAIDFFAAADKLGIKVLCITDLIKRDKNLYYLDDDGEEVRILKIFNRIIFDELQQRDDLKREFYFRDEVDVEWIGHPNWFYRISKFTMPLLKGKYVPNSYYLDKLKELPANLEDYVLKPLYSFAGSGVIINVTREIIDSIKNKSNFLLQEKVQYHPVIETLDVPAKCEIRLMLIRSSKENSTKIVTNLMRLSKGEMVGVRYNKDRTWVGSSIGFFRP